MNCIENLPSHSRTLWVLVSETKITALRHICWVFVVGQIGAHSNCYESKQKINKSDLENIQNNWFANNPRRFSYPQPPTLVETREPILYELKCAFTASEKKHTHLRYKIQYGGTKAAWRKQIKTKHSLFCANSTTAPKKMKENKKKICGLLLLCHRARCPYWPSSV